MMRRTLIIIFFLGIALVVMVLVRTPSHQEPAEPTSSATATPKKADAYFSLAPPPGFARYEPQLNDTQELIIIENASGAGLQVFVIDYDEEGPITPERIWQDLPDAKINEPGIAQLDGVRSLFFYGFDEDVGETFEVWVVHAGKLFQIMSKKTDEMLMERILDTWQWK